MNARAEASEDRATPFALDAGRLGDYLRAAGLIGCGDIATERIAGGQSNPTYVVRSGADRLVLRKKPPGTLLPSAHAVEREYRVLHALAGTAVPVPRVLHLCTDAAVVGTPFYVMEYVDGRVFADPALPGLAPRERGEIYAAMNAVIAELHDVDPAAIGLADFGRPGEYFARQIARWTRNYRESETIRIAAMDALIDWLPAHIPEGDESVIVHGDYRIDNLVFDRASAHVLAVLDWELSTLGHPLADFAYHCMCWRIPADLWRGIAGLDLDALGIPSERQYVKMYRDATGRDPSAHWEFLLACNLFRIAAILQGIAKRAQDGNASAADAVETGRKARPLAELGWECARRVGAA